MYSGVKSVFSGLVNPLLFFPAVAFAAFCGLAFLVWSFLTEVRVVDAFLMGFYGDFFILDEVLCLLAGVLAICIFNL